MLSRYAGTCALKTLYISFHSDWREMASSEASCPVSGYACPPRPGDGDSSAVLVDGLGCGPNSDQICCCVSSGRYLCGLRTDKAMTMATKMSRPRYLRVVM